MNLALMVVFFAILFMGGFIERLFREFSLTLIAAIALSLLVSLSLTPALCARMLGRAHGEQLVGTRWFARLFGNMQRGYATSLQWALRHARLVMVLLVAVIGLNVYLYVAIPKSFLPQQDTGQLMGFVRGDDSLSYQAMQPKMESFRQHLLKDPAVADVVGFVGGSGGINNAFLMIRLKPLTERGISSQQVLDRLRSGLPVEPGARLMMFVTQDIALGSHRGRGTEHRLLLKAGELDLLREWAPRVSRALAQLPELTDVDGRSDEGALQVELSIDRVAARRLGVDVDTVTQVLNNSFSQRQVTTLFDALNQYRVVLEIDPRLTENPAVLDEVQVITSDGNRVPLSAFAHYRYTTASDRIQHEGQFAAENIGFNLAEGVSLAEAMAAIDRALAEVMLPNAVQAGLADAGAQLAAIRGEQPLLLLGVILAVYIVLGILYESFTHPLTILSTLPSAGVGALLALQWLDTEFSLIALLGLFLLIGVVMKNAILIIDVALDAERRRALAPAAAVFEAAQQRFRPILMTTVAAICGALPLMLGRGDGAELRQPLGIAIVGGLIVSQVLTLYTTPVVYLYLDRLRLWCLNRWRRDDKPAITTS
jgi:multidrug efflux pump